MLATVHGTGGYVVGQGGTLWEWVTGLTRMQTISTEQGDISRGFQPFQGLRNEQGECPPTPLIGSSCMCVDTSSNLAVAVTASGTAYVWGQHLDVHRRRYPPRAQPTDAGNGAAVAEPHAPIWTFEPVSQQNMHLIQPTEILLPAWCPRSGQAAERILLGVAGAHEVAIVTGNSVLLLHKPPHIRAVEAH